MIKKFQTIKDMTDEDKMLNTFLLISWGGILSILVIAYIGETIKGAFSLEYFIHFLIVSLIPYGVCLFQSRNERYKMSMKRRIVGCYCIMYAYVLFTGHTLLVFTYIFPILTFLVLYHDPKLIQLTGIFTLILNINFILRKYFKGEISLFVNDTIKMYI